MVSPVLPRAQAAIAGSSPPAPVWYDFFRNLLEFANQSGLLDPGVIESILARLDALEQDGNDFTIGGQMSVKVIGTPESGAVILNLENDSVTPGVRLVYGTDADGIKQWTPVLVESLEGSTYTTLQHFVNTMHSPGIITGGELSQLDADTVRISAGTGMIRVLDDDVSSLIFFDFAQQDFDIPADQDTRYYAVSYNGGTPTCIESLNYDDFDKDTELPLGSAVRFNGTMVVTPNKYRTGDPITNIIQRFDAVSPAQRDASVGGLLLGETGTRNVTVTAGRIWSRLSDFITSAKDSSVDSMVSVFYNGTGLTFTTGISQWDNQNYNDLGSGALVAIGNNKYANLWFFISIDGSQYGWAYGTGDYNSVGEAANEAVPSYLNQDFFNQALLLGRFIFQESATTASLIESAFTSLFTSQAVNTHNDLGGLQGGTVGEFFHLTSDQHTTLAPLGDTEWALDTLAIGTGADTVSQVSFAANTFPAKASTGNLVAKPITDFGLSLVDDATSAEARTTLEAMPEKLVVSGTNVDYTYVDADKNVARGKTTATARTYTVDCSVLTVGAYYYAANYASSGNVTVAAAVGTTIRLTGTATTGSRTVGPFGLGKIWIRSATEAWVDGPGVT